MAVSRGAPGALNNIKVPNTSPVTFIDLQYLSHASEVNNSERTCPLKSDQQHVGRLKAYGAEKPMTRTPYDFKISEAYFFSRADAGHVLSECCETD